MNPAYSKSILIKIALIGAQALLLLGCSILRNSHKYELADDYYRYRQPGGKYQNVYASIADDTIRIFEDNDSNASVSSDPQKDLFFLKRSFDIDVMSVGFKYRPITLNLPRQLTTDFNGNVFMGYRFDRFKIRYRETPVGVKRSYHHRAITAGGFCGLGSTPITPWTTNNLTTDEYNGLILSRGLAVMIGVNNLTVGLGVGWDYLTDRDKNIWIYQNNAWYGLALGLNLN